ncbi:hypothetical protein PENSPDRAFT_684809 [Peniophora sp. CONT]|nr:hypothetical protein PENSPDRAFT_684809 [Peniophora sp. CONT]
MNSPSVASASTGGNPFLALNDDALRDFFELMGHIDPPHRRVHEFIDPGEVRFRLGWIYLTHVNQRWRRLLLAMPSLWARVFANMPASAYEETFSRAGDASWHLSFNNEPSSRRQKLVTLAQSHMEQVRALRVSDPTDTSDWVSTLHDRNLPELVTLDISQDPMPDSDILLRCPNLRDCTLYNLPAQFIEPSLRRLVMRGDPALPDSVPTLLDTLVSLPYLEELELELLSRKPLV